MGSVNRRLLGSNAFQVETFELAHVAASMLRRDEVNQQRNCELSTRLGRLRAAHLRGYLDLE